MLFFKKKHIAVMAAWRNRKGQSRTITKNVVVTHKTHIIVLNVDGVEIRVKVSL